MPLSLSPPGFADSLPLRLPEPEHVLLAAVSMSPHRFSPYHLPLFLCLFLPSYFCLCCLGFSICFSLPQFLFLSLPHGFSSSNHYFFALVMGKLGFFSSFLSAGISIELLSTGIFLELPTAISLVSQS